MIHSQYSRLYERVGGQPIGILVNCLTGAVDLVAGATYTAFVNKAEPKTFGELVRRRFVKRGHFFLGTAEEERAFLVSVSKSLHEIRSIDATNAFWIIPTYRCNLRCAYCFQDHKLHNGKGAGSQDMTPEDAIALLEVLEQYGSVGKRHGRPRYITLFGGEPLMHSIGTTVRALVRRANEIGYKVSAVTNGIELARFSDVLGPDLVRWVQVTLDGLEKSHEKRRLGYPDSFAEIARGIDVALDRGVKISLRTNVDRRLIKELQKMDDWVRERGWTRYKNFRWYMAPVETHANSSLAKEAATTHEIISHWARNRDMRAKPPYVGKHASTLRKLQKAGIMGRIETSGCGAHTGMLFFDPKGDIYACAEQAGHGEFAVGRWRGENTARSALPWSKRHVGASQICSRCANAFFCGGGCANAALQNGDFFGPRCNGIQEAIGVASRDFAEVLLADNAVADELIASGSYSVNSDDVVFSTAAVESYVSRAACVLG